MGKKSQTGLTSRYFFDSEYKFTKGLSNLLRCIPEFLADMPWHVDIEACRFNTLFSYLRQPHQHILCFTIKKKVCHNNLLHISLLNFAVHIISIVKN